MSVYMEVQPLIVQKRMEEMEKLNPAPPTDISVTEPMPEVIQTNNEAEPQIISPQSLTASSESQSQIAS